jgi:hypothetical protein
MTRLEKLHFVARSPGANQSRAANWLSHPHERIAILVGGSLPAPAAGRCPDAVADEFLPEGHGWECKP